MLNKVERRSFPLEESRGGKGWLIQNDLDKVRRMKMLGAGVMKQPRSTFCAVRAPKLNIRRDLRANGLAQEINPRLLCYLNEIV